MTTTPATASPGAGFLAPCEVTTAVQAMYDDDVADVGFVMNLTRGWAYQPAASAALFDLLGEVSGAVGLSLRERAVLVSAAASTLGDSYCSLAWGARLATATDPDVAAGVLRGGDDGLTEREGALARWARAVATDPSATTADDVQALREAGLRDDEVFAVTTFVALRLAFSTVNAALGATPDPALLSTTPPAVVDAVTFGRPSAPQG